MYSTQYPSTDQNPYPSIAMENSFYGPLVSKTTLLFLMFLMQLVKFGASNMCVRTYCGR